MPAAGEVVAGDPEQLGVDRGTLLDEPGGGVDVGGGEQVHHPLADQHVLVERHRPSLLDEGVGVAAHRLQPLAELLGVGHRRRQGDQRHRLGQVDDDLLPDRAARAVGEVVDLVHHDVPEPRQRAGAGVQHVAEHLGGHHHDRRLAVHRHVAGEEPDPVGAVAGDEVVVLLVGQRLDRRGVEALAAGLQGQVDGELPHDRLARAGRGRDEHAAPLLDDVARAPLELVERELVLPGERVEDRVRASSAGRAHAQDRERAPVRTRR